MIVPATRPDGRPWRKYRNVGAKQTFEELPEGRVRVPGDDGRTGVFDWRGPWIEGELTQASVHMLAWVGGPDLPIELRYRYHIMPVDINRPSGWPEYLEKALGPERTGGRR